MTAQTVRERQEALRARRLMQGLTEVRGIYLPPHLHARLKAEAKRMRVTDSPLTVKKKSLNPTSGS